MKDEQIKVELSAMEPIFEDDGPVPGRIAVDRYRLIQGVRNLLDAKPSNESLKEILASEGYIPINKNTVEIEAGIDRRRFSGGASEHPELSDLLKRLKPQHGVSKTTTDQLAARGERIRILEQRLTAARSATAAQVLRIETLSKKLKSAEARNKRLESGRTTDGS